MSTGHWAYEKDWNAEHHRLPGLQGRRPNSYSLQQVNIEDLPYRGLRIMESVEALILDEPGICKDLLQRFIAEFRVISG
jgi:hypothetical protein